MLRKSVLEVTQRAKASQALRPITAGHELLPAAENGVRYVLFSANASNRKPVGQAGEKKEGAKPTEFRDPFAAEHLEQDLFVTRVHDTHNLVLNKFCIVEEHVVLPTIDYEQQETPLSTADFRAMWTAMRGLDAFAFFNCGYESGASQPHKHMQLNSYPSFKQFTGLDMVQWLMLAFGWLGSRQNADGGCDCNVVLMHVQPPLLHFIDQKLKAHPTTHAVHLPELPFFHFLHRLDFAPDTSSTDAAGACIYGAPLTLSLLREYVCYCTDDCCLVYGCGVSCVST